MQRAAYQRLHLGLGKLVPERRQLVVELWILAAAPCTEQALAVVERQLGWHRGQYQRVQITKLALIALRAGGDQHAVPVQRGEADQGDDAIAPRRPRHLVETV